MSGFLTYDQIVARDPKAFVRLNNKQQLAEDRKAWLASRRGRVTASAAYKLFTKTLKPSEAKVATQYINERISESLGSQVPPFSSKAASWGNEQEPYAVISYMKRTSNVVTKWGDGQEYKTDGIVYQSDGQEFVQYSNRLGATPDGLILPEKTLQVKCPHNPGIHLMYLRINSIEEFKKLLPEYYIQIQMEQAAVKAKVSKDIIGCDFISYDPRIRVEFQLKVLEIPYDNDFQKTLSEVLSRTEEEIERSIKDLS